MINGVTMKINVDDYILNTLKEEARMFQQMLLCPMTGRERQS